MNAQRLIELIALADLALLWVGIIGYASRFTKLYPPLKFFYAYLVLAGITELLSKLYLYYWQGNNLYLFYLFIIGEMILLSLMYIRILEDQKKMLLLRGTLGIVLISVTVHGLWKIGMAPREFNLYGKLLVNAIMIYMASLFFIRSLLKPGRYMKHFSSLAYVNSAVLFYFAGTFIIYVIFNKIVNTRVSDSANLWVINVILTFIFHLICIIALWQKDSRQTKTLHYG